MSVEKRVMWGACLPEGWSFSVFLPSFRVLKLCTKHLQSFRPEFDHHRVTSHSIVNDEIFQEEKFEDLVGGFFCF